MSGERMSMVAAVRHLQERALTVAQADSRARPRWREADIEAVLRLLERPAVAEQIALARIEGRVAGETVLYQSSLRDIENIARKGLGL